MKKPFFPRLFFAFFWISAPAFGQAQDYAWVTLTQTPDYDDFPLSLSEMTNGDLVVFANSGYGVYSTSSNGEMVKFDSLGDTVFVKPFAGRRFDKVIPIIGDRFLGFEWRVADTALHAYKIGPTGEIVWEKKLNGELWRGLYANFGISENAGGFAILATRNDTAGSQRILDAQVDSLLDSVELRRVTLDTAFSYTPAVHAKAGGGYIVSVQIYQQSYGFSHFKRDLMKIDSAGRRMWTTRLLPTTFSQQSLLSYGVPWLEALPTGQVSLLLTTSPIGGSHDMTTEWIVVNGAGNITLQKTIGRNVLYSNMTPLPGGNRIFTGNTSVQQTRSLLKTDSLGNLIDLKVTTPLGYEFYNTQVLRTRDGGFAFLDRTRYGTSSSQETQDLVLSKIGQEAIAIETKSAARNHPLLEAFPNPFSAGVKLRFLLASAGRAELRLFSGNGREVAVIFSGNAASGVHEIFWKAFGIPPGVYFCRLKAGPAAQTKKLLLLR